MAEITINELNERIVSSASDLINKSEDRYHKYIADIADRVAKDEKIKVVLLAGPSGSGKTTTANLLSDAVTARGRESFVVSLDNFYRDSSDKDYPRTEDGARDYEAVEALNISDVEKTLTDIAGGRDFILPRYDFKVGARVEEKLHSKMPHGCVVIEGLHALNPKIFSCLSADNMLKIFISVSTNVNEDGERILSGRKIRFVRRMVRDNLYRGTNAKGTLSMWGNVLLGEDKYLYPFRDNADVTMDTFHYFELAAMKPFALKLIDAELANENEYARTVYEALNRSAALDDALVPQNSLIREFIPGGIYESLY